MTNDATSKHVQGQASLTLGRVSPNMSRKDGIARPKLLQKFRDASHCSLIVLRDIAGTGKTTLSRQWALDCLSRGEFVCWLMLEVEDNDLNTFLVHLVEALEFAGLPLEPEMSILVRSSPVSPYKIVLTSLLNLIAEQPRRATILLDDLQVAAGSDVRQALNWILDHLPPNLQLVVNTRETLPFKMPRLRAEGVVFEFPQSDLRFSAEETQQFFVRELGDNIVSFNQLEKVLAATRGWPVALQFMVLAAKQSSGQELRQMIHGAASGLFAFLREEVFSRLSKDRRQFVICSAILPILTEEACNVVLGYDDSAVVLQWLENNSFILRETDESYRFCHPLLREFLLIEQKAMDEGTIVNLHLNASNYFQENGDCLNAIDHAIKAEKLGKAAKILEQEGMTLIRASRIQELKTWLEIVPDTLIEQNPRLELFWIWVLFHSANPRQAVSRMANLLRRLKRNELEEHRFGMAADDFDAEIRVLAAGVLSAAGRSALARQVALSSLSALRARSGFNKGTLCNILGYCEIVLGDVAAARAASRLGYKNHKRADSVFGVTYSELLTAVAEIEACDPFKAEYNLRRGRDFVMSSLGKGSYAEALLSITESEIKYNWNQLDKAQELLDASLPLVEQNSPFLFMLNGGILEAKLAAAKGDFSGAIEILDQLDAEKGSLIPSTIRHCSVDEKVRILLHSSDLISARVALHSAGIDPEARVKIDPEKLSIGAIAGHIATSRILIAEDSHPEALGILKVLEEDALERERNLSLITIRGLMAVSLWKTGDFQQSTNILLNTIVSLISKSVARSFLDLGKDVLEPLKSARRRSLQMVQNASIAAFCSSLIQELEGEGSNMVNAPTSGKPEAVEPTEVDFLEPLTDREHEISLLLADGMTNSQISASLSITIDTTKWHLKNVFQKLGVSNRTQAVIALTGQRSFLSGDD